MKINWGLRLKNKTTLVSLTGAAVAFVYNVAAALGLAMPIGQADVLSAIGAAISVLAAFGIVVDPTTAGVSDSERALNYIEPEE